VNNILIVDDHPLIVEIMGAVARAAFPGAAVRSANGLADALKSAHDEGVDLVLLDLGLPGCRDISALTLFRAAFPGARVVVVSAIEERSVVLAALEAGAAGYIPKTSRPEVIAAALKLVGAGGIYVPPQAIDAEPPHPRRARAALTGRQLEVLRLIVRGLANKEIAQSLRIAKDTVKQHAKAVYAVLGVSNRAQAGRAAERRGIKLDQ
jgi:DNA-binding NarL/FixJ family response regulator